MQNYPGYLIPANPQPDGFICLRVFIPADDVYLYAFSGAFQFFGKWLAWERDPDHKAAAAALAWREAIAKTFEEGWLNCGENNVCEHCDLIPVILERLEELTNMNINVNCGCGCGCGSSSQTQQPPTDDDYPIQPVPPIPTPEDEPGLIWKCNMAHYCAYLLRKWGMYAADAALTDMLQDTQNVWLNLGQNSPPYALRLAYSTTAILHMGSSNSASVAAAYDPLYDTYVCAIYSAPTAAAALDNIREVNRTLLGSLGAGMDWAALLLPLVVAFTPQSSNDNLPPAYQNRTCDICTTAPTSPGLPIPIPTNPDSKFWLVPMPISGDWLPTANNGSASIAYNPNVWQQTALTNLTYHEIDVTIPNLAQIITAMNTEYSATLPGNVISLAGHYIEFVYGGNNVQDGFEYNGADGSADGFHPAAGKTCVAYSTEYMNGGGGYDLDYEAFVNGADESGAYGNSDMTAGKAYFGLNSYGSTGAANLAIRHWYIAELEL